KSAAPSVYMAAVSALNHHFPLLGLPDKALKRVISYLSLPLRSKLRLCKRLRDIEGLAPLHIDSIQILFCDDNFLLFVVESKSDEERILNKMREKEAAGGFEGVTMESILKEDEEDENVEDFDYSSSSYGFRFNSQERISVLHDLLKRLDTADIFRFELDTWVSPYFYDDIINILQGHALRIEHLTLRSTTEKRSLFDTMQVDKGVAVGYQMASVHHDNRVLTDEFLLAFVFDKTLFESYILHLEVTAKALHEVYTVMAEGECSLANFIMFVKVSELRKMRKLMGMSKVKDEYKTTGEHGDVQDH
ncbi:hypothetical protein PMAYCL1PPCAC_24326, partial [Pristionchus mayeri]